jgi:hypothetical protein
VLLGAVIAAWLIPSGLRVLSAVPFDLHVRFFRDVKVSRGYDG